MKDSEAGFTLIELLTAMTAAGLLLAALSWSVSRLGVQLAGSQAKAPVEEVAAFDPVLRSLVGGARIVDGESLHFSRDEVRFTSAMPQGTGVPGAADIILRVSGQRGSKVLEGTITPQAAGAARQNFRMRSGWTSIRIAPLGDGTAADGQAGLRIDFTGREGNAALVALTRINTAGDCEFDLISMSCRA